MVKPELKSNLIIPNPEVLYSALIFLGLVFLFFFFIFEKGRSEGRIGLNYCQGSFSLILSSWTVKQMMTPN